MHLCTFAVGKGEMPPVFFSKIGFAPFGPLCPARFSRLPPPRPRSSPFVLFTQLRTSFESVYTSDKRWDSSTSCVCLFTQMSTSAHLTKVKLLDFSCLYVYRSGKPLHTWQGWNPMTSLVRCSTHMWEPLNLAKVRVLDFRTLSVYTFVHGVTSMQSETLRLPQFVCAHICERLHIWQKWDSSTSCVCQFIHLSTSTYLTKGSLLDFRRLSVYTSVKGQAFSHLARVRSLDLSCSLACTSVNAAKSNRTEPPGLPHSVCLHVSACQYIWRKRETLQFVCAHFCEHLHS